MRVTQIICLIFVVIGCNNSNNDKIIPQKEFESVSQHNDSLTDEILNSTFTKYDGDTHNGVRTLINLKQIRKIYRSKLLENNKNDINTDDILKRYLKTTAIIYDNYYNLESILEKNLDTFNINQVISSNKKLEEASVSSVVSEYFENIKNVR